MERTVEYYRPLVRKGIQFLNYRRKEGLRYELDGGESQINLDLLDITSETQCVLGQLFGDYYYGLGVISCPNPAGYGFDLDSVDWEDAPLLTQAWREELIALRMA